MSRKRLTRRRAWTMLAVGLVACLCGWLVPTHHARKHGAIHRRAGRMTLGEL